MYFWERKSGLRNSDEKSAGCGILVRKEWEYGIRTPFETLFTWTEEDASARKILEGETNFRLIYVQKFCSGGCWKSNKTVGL